MFRLSRRNINRLAVLALLAAPIIYLFGGLFTGLVGAHGSIVYADPVEDGYDMSVEIDGQKYERYCFYGEDAYLTVDKPSGSFFQYDFSWFYCYPNGISCQFSNSSDYLFRYWTNIPLITDEFCFGFFDRSYFYYESSVKDYYFSVCFGAPQSSYIVSFEAWYNVGSSSLHFNAFQVSYEGSEWVLDGGPNDDSLLSDFDSMPYYIFFGNDFSTYGGNGVINYQLFDVLDEYRKASLVPPKKYAPATASSPSLNSEYVFGQFFQHDNFLTKMGRDVAASDNPPYGFAPVGMFINYVDVNMLHFYPTDNGMGLFFYGYFYWCAHVLLLDFAFYGVTFIIRLLKKMMERLEGD